MMNRSQHIEISKNGQNFDPVAANRLGLETSVVALRWLAKQGCALRGHITSHQNQGNFIELIKFIAKFDAKVHKVVLSNSPNDASYICSTTQKKILGIISSKVRKTIRDEIGDAKFCVLIGEYSNYYMGEQVALMLRFVDKEGVLKERFFDLIPGENTNSLTLKNEILDVLSRHSLDLKNLRGQGYDGASDMRAHFKGLQTLFHGDCSYAYFVHCFSHPLLLALVGAAKDVIVAHNFFSTLSLIIRIVSDFFKRHDESHEVYGTQCVGIDKGDDQLLTLQRAGDTSWSSHLHSVFSLLRMFDAISVILQKVVDVGPLSQQAEANKALEELTSFEFLFILHLMKEILGITNLLCQVLQQGSQDIINVMQLVKSTKKLLQDFRETGYNVVLREVKLFCSSHDVEVPDMNVPYKSGCGRRLKMECSVEHHYRVSIFLVILDSQLQELDNRFNEQVVELLLLSSSLDPRSSFTSFNSEKICDLVNKFYPEDFTDKEKNCLLSELQQYESDVCRNPNMIKYSTLSELCHGLVQSGKSTIYPLVSRLIRLVLTLPISTATTERAFSAMNAIKTQIEIEMEDEFLRDRLLLYIEKEIADQFSNEDVINDFFNTKE